MEVYREEKNPQEMAFFFSASPNGLNFLGQGGGKLRMAIITIGFENFQLLILTTGVAFTGQKISLTIGVL